MGYGLKKGFIGMMWMTCAAAISACSPFPVAEPAVLPPEEQVRTVSVERDGVTADCGDREQIGELLLAGHIGKLVKLAGGIMNTHSRTADCRCELFCAPAAAAGASQGLCRRLLGAATTDACIALLDEEGLRGPVLAALTAAAQRHLEGRAAGAYRAGVAFFSNQYGLLGASGEAAALTAEWRRADARTE